MNCIQVMIRKRLKKNIPLVFAVFTYIVILPSKIARLDGFFEERFFLVKSVKTSPTKVIWLKKVCLHSHFLSYPWYVLLRKDVRGDFNIHGIKYFKMLFSVKYQKNMISKPPVPFVGQKTCPLHEILTQLVITENPVWRHFQ